MKSENALKSTTPSTNYKKYYGVTSSGNTYDTNLNQVTIGAVTTEGSTYNVNAYGISESATVQFGGSTTVYPSAAQSLPLFDIQARADIDNIKNILTRQDAVSQRIEETVDELGIRLDRIEGAANKSISETVTNFLQNVERIRAVYLEPTNDGYRVILTYPSSITLVEFLNEVVPAEIEIDKRYKDVYFDFTHLMESDFSITSFPKAKKLKLARSG